MPRIVRVPRWSLLVLVGLLCFGVTLAEGEESDHPGYKSKYKKKWRLFGGIETRWVEPSLGGETAFGVESQSGGIAVTERVPFDASGEGGVTVELGLINRNGSGFRVRYTDIESDWTMRRMLDGSGSAFIPRELSGTPDDVSVDGATQASGFFRTQVNAWDFEAFRDIYRGPMRLSLSAGIRQAKVTTHQSGSALNDNTGIGFGGIQRSVFSGIGPTMAADVTVKVHGPLSVYGNARASLLFGDSDTTQSLWQAGMPLSRTDIAGVDRVVTAYEANVGLQFDVGPTELRLGWATEVWDNLGFSSDGDLSFSGATFSIRFKR